MPLSQDVVTIGGLALAVPALWFTAGQLRQARKTSRMQAMMNVESLLEGYRDVHARLRHGGTWCKPEAGPESESDWDRVDCYMGLLERMKVAMLDSRDLDLDTFDRMYGHRILDLDRNDVIRERLEDPGYAPHWRDFLELRDAVREHRGLPPRRDADGTRRRRSRPRTSLLRRPLARR
jgi:hypothetical protein